MLPNVIKGAPTPGNADIEITETFTIDKPNVKHYTQQRAFNTKTLIDDLSQYNVLDFHAKTTKSPKGSAAKGKKSTIATRIINQPMMMNTRLPKTKSTLSPLRSPKNTKVLGQLSSEESITHNTEDPITYFSKHRDGSGAKFIYLEYKHRRGEPNFSPYEIRKIPYDNIGEDYFTMTANGVTHFVKGKETDQISLSDWVKEQKIYQSICKLRFFRLYLYWKHIRTWRECVQVNRYTALKVAVPNHYLLSHSDIATETSQISKKIFENMSIIQHHLIPYKIRKMTLENFQKICKENRDELNKQYNIFIKQISNTIVEICKRVSNQSRLIVTESDFDEIRRVNPNITQLQILEKKKESKRKELEKLVADEHHYLNDYVRLIDYMIIESNREACFNVFQRLVDIINDDNSALFEIDVFYADDGTVSFKPSLEEILKVTKNEFQKSLKLLKELPRIFDEPRLLSHLLEPNFEQKLSTEKLIDSASNLNCSLESIFNALKESYGQSQLQSQIFNEYYQLYKLGEFWNSRAYITTQDGQPFTGPLSIDQRPINEDDDYFLVNSQNEPTVDFGRLRQIIKYLQDEEYRSSSIRGSITIGTYQVESLHLRGILTPIPRRSLNDLEKALKELCQLKIDLMHRFFRSYGIRLRNASSTLKVFVDICFLLTKVEELMPKITQEIKFVDDIITLLDASKMQSIASPLHGEFDAFKKTYNDGIAMRNYHAPRFEVNLKKMISAADAKLNELYIKAKTLPQTFKDINLEEWESASAEVSKELSELKPYIEEYISFQKILEVDVTTFPIFTDTTKALEFASQVYAILHKWDSCQNQISYSPFVHVSMDTLKKELSELSGMLLSVKENWSKNAIILDQIEEESKFVSPYLDVLTILANGNMEEKHWIQLFTEAGKAKEYQKNMTIKNLIDCGILKSVSLIKSITKIAVGQASIITEFHSLRSKWEDIHIPLSNENIGNQKLVLGSTKALFVDIEDAMMTLDTMSSNEHACDLRYDLLALRSRLDQSMRVLRLWERFQGNWIIIDSLFKQEKIAGLLQPQLSAYNHVLKKWNALTHFALQNTRLLHVCTFENIEEDFTENVKILEYIFTAIAAINQKKRQEIPRLYFLSDDEVTQLLSTYDYNTFSGLVMRMLMNIDRLDSHQTQIDPKFFAESRFAGRRIFSVVGNDQMSLEFSEAISMSQPIEKWIPQMLDVISFSLKKEMKKSFQVFHKNSISEWIMSQSSYICALTLLTNFSSEVDEAMDNLETNPRSFQGLQNRLQQNITDITSSFQVPMHDYETAKTTMCLMIVSGLNNKLSQLFDRSHHSSPKIAWRNMIKHRFNPNTGDIFIEYGDAHWHHGGEYWGDTSDYLSYPEMDNISANYLFNKDKNRLSLLFGNIGIGKSDFVKSMAVLLGNSVFTFMPFEENHEYYAVQNILGAITTGSTLIFKNVEELKHNILSSITDLIESIHLSVNSGSNSILIQNKEYTIDLRTSIVMTTSLSSINNSPLPQNLVSFSRPIAFMKPSINEVSLIRLQAFGFKTASTTSESLAHVLQTIHNTYDIPFSQFSAMHNIINDANGIILQVKHTTNVQFLHYDDIKTTEEYAIAVSIYNRYNFRLVEKQQRILARIIYSGFRLFGSYGLFLERIMNPNLFAVDYMDHIVKEHARKYIKNLNCYVPEDYIVEKTSELVRLMQRYSTIVMTGPPNSGKSTVLKVIKEIFPVMGDIQRPPKMSGLRPFRMETVYHNASEWNKFFGNYDEDKFSYGELQSLIFNLLKTKDVDHLIAIFDGHITSKFANFIAQMSNSGETILMNTGTSFLHHDNFHIIIESDNISEVTPTFLQNCGIFTMEVKEDPIYAFKDTELKYEGNFSPIEPIFCDTVRKTLEDLKNYKPIINLEEMYMSLCMNTAREVLNYITVHNIDISDEEEVRTCVVLCCYYVFSSIIETSERNKFDLYLRTTFMISINQDWQGYKVEDPFWDAYSHPSMSCIRMYKKKLIPLSQNDLNTIIYKKDQPIIKPIEAISIHAQMLPGLFVLKTNLINRSNIILTSPKGSGKSSFLRIAFSVLTEYNPMYINVDKYTTPQHIIEILKRQTDLLAQTKQGQTSTATTVLVFENIEEEGHCSEFIRMMIEKRTIPFYSDVDPKIYTKVFVNNFSVIVSTPDISKLSSRFISQFLPLSFDPILTSSENYVTRKIMVSNGVQNNLARFSNCLFDELKCSIEQRLQILYYPINSKEKNGKNMNEKLHFIHQLLSEIYFMFFNCNEEKFEQFIQKCESIFDNNDFTAAFQMHQMNFTPLWSTYSEDKVKTRDFTTSEMKKQISQITTGHVNEQTCRNYALLSNLLTHPFCHVLMPGANGSGKLNLIRYVAYSNKFILVDLTKNRNNIKGLLKTVIDDIIFKDKTHIILAEINENEEDIFQFLVSLFIKGNTRAIFSERDLDNIVQRIVKHELPSKIQRLEAKKAIQNSLVKVHLVISTPKHYDFTLNNSLTIANLAFPSIRQIFTEYLSKDLLCASPAFTRMSTQFNEILDYTHPSTFENFIGHFALTATNKKDELEERSLQINAVIAFIEMVNNDLNEVLDKIQKKRKKISETTKNIQMLDYAIDVWKGKVQQEKTDIHQEMIEKKADVKGQNDLIQEMESEAHSYSTSMEQARGELMALPPTACAELRTLCLRATPTSRIIFETCFLMTKNTAIGDDFIDRIVNIDMSTVQARLFDNFQNAISTRIIVMKDLVGPLRPLFDFLNAAKQYTEKRVKTIQLKQNLINVQKSSEMFLQTAEMRYDAVINEESQCEHQERVLALLEQQNADDEAELDYLENRKIALESIQKDTDSLMVKWKEELTTFSDKEISYIGDTIITSAYMVYCGMLSKDKKIEFLAGVLDTLQSCRIETSFSQPVDGVEELMLTPPGIDLSLYLPRQMLVSLTHIIKAPLPPLIIDPDGITTEIIAQSFMAQTVSVLSHEFAGSIKEAMMEGTAIVIIDVDDTDPDISTLISLLPNEKNAIIGSEMVEIREGFKFFLITNLTDPHQMSQDLLGGVTLIDCRDSARETADLHIQRAFVDYFDPDIIAKVTQNEEKEREHNEQVIQFEQNLVEALSNFATLAAEEGYDYTSDYESIQSVMSAKDFYFAATSTSTDFSGIHKELNVTIRQLVPHIELCQIIWHSLSAYMPKVSKNYKFGFNSFLSELTNMFVAINLQNPSLAPDLLEKNKLSLIQNIAQLIFPSMSFSSSFFFLFLIGFRLKRKPVTELQIIADHITEQLNEDISLTAIESASISDILENLKFTTIESVFPMMERFIMSTFGRDCFSSFHMFSIDDIFPGKRWTPIIISTRLFDPTALIHSYVNDRMLQKNFVSITLSEERVEATKALFEEAKQNGNILVLYYDTPSRKVGTLINDFIVSSKRRGTPEGFRLIICCRIFDYLSPGILSSTKRFEPDIFPSPRHIMNLLFTDIRNLPESDHSRTQRRVLYLCSMIYTQMIFSSMVKPIGISQSATIPFSDFGYLISEVKRQTEISGTPIKNIKAFATNIIFGSQLIEPEDRRKLSTLVGMMLSNDCLSDGFIYIDQASDGFIWSIPEANTNAMQAAIGRLSVFPTIDFLGVNSRSEIIRNWRLSEWISQPFTCITSPDLFIDYGSTQNLPEPIDDYLDDETTMAAFINREILEFNSALKNKLSAKSAKELLKRREQLKALLAEDCPEIDIGLLSNPEGLLLALITDYNIDKIQLLNYGLEVTAMTDPDETAYNGIILKPVYLFNAALDHNNLLTPPSIFMKSPKLNIKPIKVDHGQKPEIVQIPVTDGQKVITLVNFSTDKPEKHWVMNSSSIYVKKPYQIKV